jgi:hypothetical protein
VGVAALNLPTVRLPDHTYCFVERSPQWLEGTPPHGSSWLTTARLRGRRERHRGARSLGHRRTPPRAESHLLWCIRADRPTVFRGAHQYRSLDISSTCGDSAPNASQSSRFSTIVVPSPAAPQSLMHVRGQSSLWRLTRPVRRRSWRLRRRPFSKTGSCGVRLRTPPACSAAESV